MHEDHENTRRAWRLPDELWARIVPLLPPRQLHALGCHRPRVEDRKAMDAIFFVLRTDCQWNALKETGIGSSRAAHRRFQEWTAAGGSLALWKSGLMAYEALQGIAWEWPAHLWARGEGAKARKQDAGCRARRWVVERTPSGMNRCRRVLIRWDKNMRNDLGFLHVACAYITYRPSGLLG